MDLALAKWIAKNKALVFVGLADITFI